MSEKIIINKRNVNDLIYKLFEDGRLKQIVRHFKLIIKSNCEVENNNLILSQKTENFNGTVLYPPLNKVNNIIDDTSKISFGDKHTDLNEIKDIIQIHKDEVLSNYIDTIINSQFNTEKEEEIESELGINNENGPDNVYIRCGIDPDDKQFYLLKLFELYISSYFNDLSADAQNKLLDDNLLPMYNDTIFLGNNKYNFLIDKIKESTKHRILKEFNENNN
jgi:hypothetical protein